MSWLGKPAPYEPEIDPPSPPRTASDEYLEGLKFVAGVYEARAKAIYDLINQDLALATSELAKRSCYYEGRVDRALAEAQSNWLRVQPTQSAADEIREWIRQFEFQGYRPPHLPPLPPDNTPHESGE